MTGIQASSMSAEYERCGVVLLPPVLPVELVARVAERLDAVVDGHYLTGREPHGRTPLGASLTKIDQPHRCDPVIADFIRRPEIGEAVAAVTGAQFVQVFAVQLLHKRPDHDPAGSVGWHQDDQYWRTWYEGECLTAWVALSDVSAEAGPVRFVIGSHLWGPLPGGDFFGHDLAGLRERISLPEGARWREVAGVLAPGAISLHHRLTLHGSSPNTSRGPRRSFAIHVRTERSRPLAAPTIHTKIDDLEELPVIYDRRTAAACPAAG